MFRHNLHKQKVSLLDAFSYVLSDSMIEKKIFRRFCNCVVSLQYEHMYVSSYRIFGEIASHSMGKGTVAYRSESEDVWRVLKIFWIVFHKYDIHKPFLFFADDRGCGYVGDP